MKKIPIIPPLSALESALFTQEFGILISNAPKNETAKTTKIKKNTILNVGFVDISFNAFAPNVAVTTVPKSM